MVARPSFEPRLTVNDYLNLERDSTVKHQFYNGEIYAMAGAHPVHNEIAVNGIVITKGQVGKGKCKVYGSDQRVKTPTGLYTYPDISIVCGKREFNNDKPPTLLNPTVIIEVLSPTTETFDRGEKFHQYRSIQSLQAYILISSTSQRIEYFARQENNLWRIDVVDTPDGLIEISAVGCTLSIADVYADVEFEAE
jgi:Uma2 family endonuclease